MVTRAELLIYDLEQLEVLIKQVRVLEEADALYLTDGTSAYIAIAPDINNARLASLLAHEAGHHHMGLTGHTGRDEARANRWAVDYLLSPQDIANATLKGAHSYHELADMLDLDEDFVRQAVAILAMQFGPVIELEQHVLHLQPIWVEDRSTGQTWPAE